MSAEEVWRAIPGVEQYEVSDLGRVRSWKKSRWNMSDEPRIVKPHRVGQRMLVQIAKKTYRVHSLVALAFLGPRPEGMQICHGAQGRLVNSIDNLEYGTVEKNQGPDRLRDGTDNRGEKHGQAKLTREDVTKIKEMYGDIRLTRKQRYHSGLPTLRELGVMFGVSASHVSTVVQGRNWEWINNA